MFKSAISSLASAVFKTAGASINQYKPNTQNIVEGAYSHLVQQGIANMAYRSPLMADIAANAFHTFQTELVKKKQNSEYVKSSEADWMREKVKTNLGGTASEAKINDEMMKIISKISKQIDKVGVEETKKSNQFKEFEQYFDKFTQATQKHAPETTQNGAGGEVLDRIEANTKQTVNALETLNIRGGDSTHTSSTTTTHAPSQQPSFVDQFTGMPSMRAGIGSVGGMLLGKIFDDKLIDKLAKKAKKVFNLDEEEAPEKVVKKSSTKRPTKFGDAQSVEKMFPKDLFDIKKEIYKPPVADSKELSQLLKEHAVKPSANKVHTKTSKEYTPPVVTKIQDPRKIEEAIKLIVPKIFKAAPIGKAITNLSSSVASKADIAHLAVKLMKHAPIHVVEKKTPPAESGSLLSTATGYMAGKALGGALGKIGRGAGKAVGTISRVAAAAPSVASSAPGVASAAGGILSRFALPAVGAIVGGVSAPVLGAIAGVGALGYGAYKFLNRDKTKSPENIGTPTDKKIDLVKPTISSDSTAQSKTKIIENLENRKANLVKESKAADKAQPPVILNTSNNKSSAPPPNNNIVGTSVRNKDSTFERVQMQDFWPRIA